MASGEQGMARAKAVSEMADLAQLRSVIAQLEATIRVLRGELEHERNRGESAVREAHAEHATEIAALKAMIDTMRGRLEQGEKAGDAAVQSVRAAGRSEAAELQATIVALRAELEAERERRSNEVSDRERV